MPLEDFKEKDERQWDQRAADKTQTPRITHLADACKQEAFFGAIEALGQSNIKKKKSKGAKNKKDQKNGNGREPWPQDQ